MDCFDQLLNELEDVVVTLETWRGASDPLPAKAARDLAKAYDYFREFAHQLPGAEAWVVVKHYAPRHSLASKPKPWPGMAFTNRRRAEAWADFLSDYYNTWGDWFEVERRAPSGASDHAWEFSGYGRTLTFPDDRPVGDGYFEHDHRKPMERWELIRPERGGRPHWRRVKKAKVAS